MSKITTGKDGKVYIFPTIPDAANWKYTKNFFPTEVKGTSGMKFSIPSPITPADTGYWSVRLKLEERKNKDGEIVSDVNGALRVLKKRMMKDGFFQDLRERSHFTSKGEKKRKAKAAGRRRWLKKVEKRKLELGY